jgi:uncharacterized membrane protein
MSTRSKYDTNPLDPDVAKGADEAWGQTQESDDELTRALGSQRGAPVTEQAYEAPTRRYDARYSTSYPSVFVPPPYQPPSQPPANFQTAGRLSYSPAPTCRSVAGIGIPENIASILPYAPAYIGIVASIIELFLVPRSETRVRFHAAQGFALQIAMVAITLMFKLVSTLTGSGFGGWLFGVASFFFLIYSMVRVWRGKPHNIAPLSEGTAWLNQHIEPRNR